MDVFGVNNWISCKVWNLYICCLESYIFILLYCIYFPALSPKPNKTIQLSLQSSFIKPVNVLVFTFFFFYTKPLFLFLKHSEIMFCFRPQRDGAPPNTVPGCSRHLLLAVRLVGRARGHDGLLEALHTPLHGAAHVPAHHIGAPVPEERRPHSDSRM